jgi:hypothetical protein
LCVRKVIPATPNSRTINDGMRRYF